MNLAHTEDSPLPRGAKPGEWLLRPVTLQRDLQVFKGVLDFSPGRPVSPRADLLLEVLSGKTVLGHLREVLAEQFKNFLNARGGRHRTSPTTLKGIRMRLGPLSGLFMPDQYDEAPQLAALVDARRVVGNGAAGSPDRLQMPEFTEFVMNVCAGIVSLQATLVHDADPKCPCCRQSLLGDPGGYWAKLGLPVPQASYELADELLGMIAFVDELARAFRTETLGKTTPWLSPGELLARPRTPIGNWLVGYATIVGADSLPELSAWLQIHGVSYRKHTDISTDRLKHWSSCQDLMPVPAMEALVAACDDQVPLRWHHYMARLLTFVCDFIGASTPSCMEWADVQAGVKTRLAFLTATERMKRGRRRT
jgi:hypothetical protein